MSAFAILLCQFRFLQLVLVFSFLTRKMKCQQGGLLLEQHARRVSETRETSQNTRIPGYKEVGNFLTFLQYKAAVLGSIQLPGLAI